MPPGGGVGDLILAIFWLQESMWALILAFFWGRFNIDPILVSAILVTAFGCKLFKSRALMPLPAKP